MLRSVIIIFMGICVLTGGNLKGQTSCDWEMGDFDCNGIPFELADVIVAIGNYRGTAPPCYFCDCGIYGENFAFSADVNGNCIPYELSDLIAGIAIYRGVLPFFVICEGCYDRVDQRPEDPGANSGN